MTADVRGMLLVLLLAAGDSSFALPAHNAKPGGIAVIDVGPGASAPQVYFGERRSLIMREGGRWFAVVGIPLSHAIGTASIKVVAGDDTARVIEFEIVSFEYREQHLSVERNYVEPDPDSLDRIFGERKIIDGALNHWADTTVDSLSLESPVAGRRSSSFGFRRFFNNQPRSPHSGMDIAADSGTTVVAPLAGVVVATGHYFFNGNTVMLDHGQGFVTMYCHLDRIDVAETEHVAAGMRLGIVGNTGRVTGPHLHFGTYLGGTAVDPALLLP